MPCESAGKHLSYQHCTTSSPPLARGGFQMKRRLFPNEPAPVVPLLGSCPRGCRSCRTSVGAEEAPTVTPHPQSLAANAQHSGQFLCRVAVLISFDELGNVILDGQRCGKRVRRRFRFAATRR